MRVHKLYWCPMCGDESVVAAEGEVSDCQPYAVGQNPIPDEIEAKAAWCEHGHELDLAVAQEIMESVLLKRELI